MPCLQHSHTRINKPPSGAQHFASAVPVPHHVPKSRQAAQGQVGREPSARNSSQPVAGHKDRRKIGEGSPPPLHFVARVEVVRDVPPRRVAAEDRLLGGVWVPRGVGEVQIPAVSARGDVQNGRSILLCPDPEVDGDNRVRGGVLKFGKCPVVTAER